ncbi:MAG: hypothetical protein PWR04_700 [Anaerophaga sp.]|nr:hypothetical protein [Anaerophaga sp.]
MILATKMLFRRGSKLDMIIFVLNRHPNETSMAKTVTIRTGIKHHLTSNNQRNQKKGTDSSSLPPQNDKRPFVILTKGENLKKANRLKCDFY